MSLPRDIDARRYFRAGKQRLLEAEVILEKVRLPAASIYLAGYAVECMLKALLVERTPEVERKELVDSLKHQLGHNFDLLRAGLVGRGVAIPKGVLGELVFVSMWSPARRYEPGPGDIVAATRFLKAVRKIVGWTEGRI